MLEPWTDQTSRQISLPARQAKLYETGALFVNTVLLGFALCLGETLLLF